MNHLLADDSRKMPSLIFLEKNMLSNTILISTLRVKTVESKQKDMNYRDVMIYFIHTFLFGYNTVVYLTAFDLDPSSIVIKRCVLSVTHGTEHSVKVIES